MAQQETASAAKTTEADFQSTQIRIKECPKMMPDIKEHFEIVEKCKLPDLKVDQLLIEAEYISVDPYQRSRMKFWFENDPQKQMHSFTVAKVIASQNAGYKAGDYVYGVFPWSTRHIVDVDKVMSKITPDLSSYKPKEDKDYIEGLHGDDDGKFDIETISKIPHSYFVGSCGMPGITAYYGMIYRGGLKRGDNVLISGAAGAVGSLCGQIAKAVFGCHVVGICGTKAKMDWLTKDLGFDGAINYKEYGDDFKKVQNALKSKFPKGIDLFYDNVGGIFTEAAWDLLNVKARVLICGQISTYNDDPMKPKLVRPFLHKLIYREIDVRGLIQNSFTNHTKFYYDMSRWILSGKIKVKETVVDGFEHTPSAFVGLFTGRNTGKMVVKC